MTTEPGRGETAPEVTVNRSLLFNGTGLLVPFSWLYEVTGPDGHRFSNKSIGDLRSALRRRYGRAVAIRQNWEGPARAVRWSDINRAEHQGSAVSEAARQPGEATTADGERASAIGLELSIWDALMVGRVSATRPGLRACVSHVAPAPVLSPTTNVEVA